jgi:hypothetical protein
VLDNCFVTDKNRRLLLVANLPGFSLEAAVLVGPFKNQKMSIAIVDLKFAKRLNLFQNDVTRDW